MVTIVRSSESGVRVPEHTCLTILRSVKVPYAFITTSCLDFEY